MSGNKKKRLTSYITITYRIFSSFFFRFLLFERREGLGGFILSGSLDRSSKQASSSSDRIGGLEHACYQIRFLSSSICMYVFLSWFGGEEEETTRVENGLRRDVHQELRMDSQFLLFLSSQAAAWATAAHVLQRPRRAKLAAATRAAAGRRLGWCRRRVADALFVTNDCGAPATLRRSCRGAPRVVGRARAWVSDRTPAAMNS
jgi:hypothetical protein